MGLVDTFDFMELNGGKRNFFDTDIMDIPTPLFGNDEIEPYVYCEELPDPKDYRKQYALSCKHCGVTFHHHNKGIIKKVKCPICDKLFIGKGVSCKK